MCRFWETILLSKSAYRGNPFPKHLSLEITLTHFDRWVFLFEQTVDENFFGSQSESLKKRARIIRQVFEAKLFDRSSKTIVGSDLDEPRITPA